MTSIASAPPPEPPRMDGKVPASEPATRRGVDYSKFDNIVDSDDDKPADSASKDASTSSEPKEKPHCYNCHKEIVKPLRCAVCKKAEYCSPQCQKDDWRFHKRTCKKPEEPKPKEKKADEGAKPSARPARPKATKEDKVVDDDEEEKLDWYRHREWKPSEPKAEFKPQQLSAEALLKENEVELPQQAGSVWNKAGTWEEKDVTDTAHKTLKQALAGLPGVDAAGGSLQDITAEDVDGDASKPVVRGILRHIFDLTFKIKFVFKWMGDGGQKKVDGTITVKDFTDNTFGGSPEAPFVEMSLGDGASQLDAARRKAVESAAVGSGAWPPAPGCLMAHVAARLETWAKEYKEESSDKPARKLPPAGGF